MKPHLEKKKILEVAVKLFSEKGYPATSIRDIAKALKISNASLYYYFKDKEHLLFSVIESVGGDLMRILDEARHESKDPLEGISRMVIQHCHLIERDGPRAKLFVEEEHNLSEKYRRVVQYQHRKIYDAYVAQLKQLQEAGIISDGPVSIIALAILGMTNWCYRWYRKEGALSIQEIGQCYSNLLIGGIMNKDNKDLPKGNIKKRKPTISHSSRKKRGPGMTGEHPYLDKGFNI